MLLHRSKDSVFRRRFAATDFALGGPPQQFALVPVKLRGHSFTLRDASEGGGDGETAEVGDGASGSGMADVHGDDIGGATAEGALASFEIQGRFPYKKALEYEIEKAGGLSD